MCRVSNEAITWGTTGRVRLNPGRRHRNTWADVLVDDRLVASVWHRRGEGWRAGLWDHCVGRMTSTMHESKDAAILWVLDKVNHEVWGAEISGGMRAP